MDNLIERELELPTLREQVRLISRRKPLSNIQMLERIGWKVHRVNVGDDQRKYILKYSDFERGVAGIASSRMYKSVGMHTPQIQPLCVTDKGSLINIQRDIFDIEGIEKMFADDKEYLIMQDTLFGKDKWQLFYDIELQSIFKSFMTHDCFEQFKNDIILRGLRSDIDGKLEHYVLCRKKGENKYSELISIDLEEMHILQFNQSYSSKQNFENFLYTPYRSATPQQTLDCASYKRRMEECKKVIRDGVLSKSNIETMKKAINYDLPKEFDNICVDQSIRGTQRRKIVEPVRRLWQYNYDNLEKEL